MVLPSMIHIQAGPDRQRLGSVWSEYFFLYGQRFLVERDREISVVMRFIQPSHRIERIRYHRMVVAEDLLSDLLRTEQQGDRE